MHVMLSPSSLAQPTAGAGQMNINEAANLARQQQQQISSLKRSGSKVLYMNIDDVYMSTP